MGLAHRVVGDSSNERLTLLWQEQQPNGILLVISFGKHRERVLATYPG